MTRQTSSTTQRSSSSRPTRLRLNKQNQALLAYWVYRWADALVQFRCLAERNWFTDEVVECFPEIVEIKAADLRRILSEAELLFPRRRRSGLASYRENVARALEIYRSAWQEDQHRRVIESLRNIESEFIFEYTSSEYNNTTFGNPIWEELERDFEELVDNLPDQYGRCRCLGTLLAEEVHWPHRRNTGPAQAGLLSGTYLMHNRVPEIRRLLIETSRAFTVLEAVTPPGEENMTESQAIQKFYMTHEQVKRLLSTAASMSHDPDGLKPSESAAYHAYCLAEEHLGNNLTDRQAYEWLKEEGPTDYSLPSFETFARYVRTARTRQGTQKNQTRRGRRGRSVVAESEIESVRPEAAVRIPVYDPIARRRELVSDAVAGNPVDVWRKMEECSESLNDEALRVAVRERNPAAVLNWADQAERNGST